VRNYGADELENIQNIPYYAEYLQTFAPLPRMVASQAPSLPYEGYSRNTVDLISMFFNQRLEIIKHKRFLIT
jgi:hypothetical protein